MSQIHVETLAKDCLSKEPSAIETTILGRLDAASLAARRLAS